MERAGLLRGGDRSAATSVGSISFSVLWGVTGRTATGAVALAHRRRAGPRGRSR
jgi:hypothetical protein